MLTNWIGSLHARWRDILQSLWFVPGATVAALVLLSFLVVEIDQSLAARDVSFGFEGDPSAARLILSSIAGSLITVAGLALSLTVLTLQLVSSQFTPRALRGFMGDRVTQVTAGLFVGVFAYCMLVLRTVRNEGDTGDPFVPSLGVTVAIALSIIALAVLLFFIHHVASSIQASSLLARIGRDTLAAINALFPEDGVEETDQSAGALREVEAVETVEFALYPERPGYVQRIDMGGLASFDPSVSRVTLHVSPGDFVTEHTPVATVRRRAEREQDGKHEQIERVGAWGISITDERDMDQDARYGLRQLVDIALRALSPGVNDPSTASTSLGYLRACLERLSTRRLPETQRYFDDHQVVVETVALSYRDYLELAFVEFAHAARGDARISIELMHALRAVAGAASEGPCPERVGQVASVAARVAELNADHDAHVDELAVIEACLDEIRSLGLRDAPPEHGT